MKITENEIWALLLGAAIGSIVTYYILTREKRIISRVHWEMFGLGNYHKLNSSQYSKTQWSPADILKDDQVLAVYRWAKQAKFLAKSGKKLNPALVAAEVIICQELLGLSKEDAVKALRNAERLNDLHDLLPNYSN